MAKALIVAEAGVNHNGDIALAHKLVDAASEAGADVVKFQTFKAAENVSGTAPKARYQTETTDARESQLDMIRKLELGPEEFRELKHHCNEIGIRFWSTAFDLPSVDFLQKLTPGMWKIPSGEITNPIYLRKIGALNEEVVMSTGMATLGEIETALDILESAGTSRNKITLLHCTTEYPAPLEDINLKAMWTMAAAFPGIRGVGYSDHTRGIEISLAAAAMGAILIEKHFTLDRAMQGPDHAASLEPAELASLVQGVRNIELALGNGIKKPAPEELENRIAARKSLVARTNISRGEIFSEANLTVKRPGSGVSAIHWDKYMGKPAPRDYRADELI